MGLIIHWERMALNEEIHMLVKQNSNSTQNRLNNNEKIQNLTLSNISFLIFMLLFGYVSSVMVLIIELLYSNACNYLRRFLCDMNTIVQCLNV